MVDDAVLSLITGKERKKYAKKHGISSLINFYHGLPWIGAESERVYAICNQKNITWEEYYGVKSNGYIY